MSVNDLLGASLDIPKAAIKAVEPVIVVPGQHADGHVKHLDDLASDVPIISYDPDGGCFRLRRGKLRCAEVHSGLTTGLNIKWPPIPHDYIPFDTNSTDIEIANAIVNSIVAQALARRKKAASIDICRDAIRYWDVLSPQQKQCLSERVTRVLEDLVMVGFAEEFEVKSKKKAVWIEVTAAATRAAMADQSLFARRLNTKASEAVDALERKLRNEAERGETGGGLFKDAPLPPLSGKRRKR